MKAHLRNALGLGFILVALSASGSASTLYVNRAISTGNNDGSSWANAYRDPDAVAVALAAALPGDDIWVAAGTYFATTTTARTLSHELKSGVGVYGGFAGNETLLAQRDAVLHVTILSGDIGTIGAESDNSHHIVIAAGLDATAILDGFTITLAQTDYSMPLFDRHGGGLRCIGGAGPTIRSCRFVDNFSAGSGGGAYVELSSPSFADCQFHSNGAPQGGGLGARSSSVVIDRCMFTSNGAMDGGGLWLVESSSPPGGPPRVWNCLVQSNHATHVGGMIAHTDADIRNCTIILNTLTSFDVLAGVSANPGTTIVNSILWGNGPVGTSHTSAQQVQGTTAITYSIVEGGFPGTGNSGSYPFFSSEYPRLHIGSRAIDAGNNAAVPAGITLDLARQPRVVDEPGMPDTGSGAAPIVDIGAYEGAIPYSLPRAFCFGNGSGAACPCGNYAPAFSGNGCLNSIGGAGRLDAEGVGTRVFDTLVLRGSQMPDGACLYLQGTAAAGGGRGVGFGDGLLCVSGSFVRLWVMTNVAGASQVPPPGGPRLSTRGGVGLSDVVRHYQVWYRDAALFCTEETWNMTNAIWVNWQY